MALAGDTIVSGRPILKFDTSAINRLTDDPDSEALTAGLTSGFYVQLTFESVEEIVATTSAGRRHSLLNICNRLLPLGGCIDPASAILEKMVAHFEGSAPFSWTGVEVGLPDAAEKISRFEDFDNELAERVQEERWVNKRSFAEVYRNAKPHFGKALASASEGVPQTPAELVARLPKTLWKTAGNVYARYTSKAADEARVREFLKECDPFRALIMAFFAAAFDRCVRSRGRGGSFRSGLVDTLMAICLPYCDQFVTDDTRSGGQRAFYKEICSLANLQHVSIRSYEEIRSALCLGPLERGSHRQ
jgi:hypothetical protein